MTLRREDREDAMTKQSKPIQNRSMARSALLVAVTALSLAGTASPAFAVCGGCTPCGTWSNQVSAEMTKHENWMTNTWWDGHVKPALEDMTADLIATITVDTYIIGTFFDAQNQLNTQRTLQELSATAVKNYTPSESLCQFGTLSRSLSASQEKAKATQIVLSERSQNRQLGNDNMTAQSGPQEDRWQRLEQFKAKFCDPADFNDGMKAVCGAAGAPASRHNLDIDFTRLVDTKKTLDINLTDATQTEDEENIIALANNLYSHQVFNRINARYLKETNAKDNRTTYLDQRALVAKRSVAENSFNAIVGMKAAGSGASKTYLEQVLQSLGLPAADVARYLGETPAHAGINPSYHAQMEVLTKKLYQNPAFYAHLMDKPVNVQRQFAAMQSFGLMQQRDIFESLLRSEMILSLIVEMEVMKYQDDVQRRLDTAK